MPTLHRSPIIALALLAAGGQAAAVEYTIPATEGWAQLEGANSYETVCTSSDPQPCDIEPGQYRLIDFGTSPATRTDVTVERSGENLGRSSLYVHSDTAFSARVLESGCPTGRVLSAQCIAISDGDEILPVGMEAIDGPDGPRHACYVTPARQGADATGSVTAQSIRVTSICER